jgi:hypothetical protein
MAMAMGSVGIRGTRMSSTLDGTWVHTIVRSVPKRLASYVALSAEIPASTFAPKKIPPRLAGPTPKREWNQ